MTGTLTIPGIEQDAGGLLEEALSLTVGAVFTLGLFLAIAHFEDTEPAAIPADIEDLRAMSVPLEAPPPRPVETMPATEAAAPFAGLEIAASDSPVKIAVVPPDLRDLVPASTAAPAATIQPARLYTEFKPQTDISGDLQRIFQQHEVDKKPTVLSRPSPRIPSVVRGRAETLRVSLLVLVDAKGGVSNIRILQSSGNPQFDAIIISDVRHAWVFSPAVRKGRHVRCLVQQTVRVNWIADSPFEA